MFVRSINSVRSFHGMDFPTHRFNNKTTINNPPQTPAPTQVAVPPAKNEHHSLSRKQIVGSITAASLVAAGFYAGRKGKLGSTMQKITTGKFSELRKPKLETPKTEITQTEAVKPEVQKTEVPKTETVKPDYPNTKVKQEQTVKPESPKAENSKTETVKQDAQKTETPKSAANETEIIKPYNFVHKDTKFDLNKSNVDPKTKNIVDEGIMTEDGVKTYTAMIKNDKGVMLERNDYNFPDGKHIRTFKYSDDGKYISSVKEYNPANDKAIKETAYRADGTVEAVAQFDEATGNAVKMQAYDESGKKIKLNTIVNPKTLEAHPAELPEQV